MGAPFKICPYWTQYRYHHMGWGPPNPPNTYGRPHMVVSLMVLGVFMMYGISGIWYVGSIRVKGYGERGPWKPPFYPL